MQTELGADVKIFDDEHVEPMLRCISDMALAEEIDILPCDASAPTRDLIVRGYLHGSALSTYDFVHLTGEGSHPIRGIRVVPDPSPLKRAHDVTERLVEADPARLRPVEEECAVDPSTVEAPHWAQPVVVRGGVMNKA